MTYQLRIFFVHSAKVFVYSLEHEKIPYIYNGSLELYHLNNIDSYDEVEGVITDSFGVIPVVLVMSSGKYRIVYAPEDSEYVYSSDGKPALHNGEKVVGESFMLMPDVDKSKIGSDKLAPISLNKYSEASIRKFCVLSCEGKEQDTNLSYQDYLKKKENSEKQIALIDSMPKISQPVVSNLSSPPRDPNGSPSNGFRSPSPKVEEQPSPEKIENTKISNLENKLEKAEKHIDRLEHLIKTLNQRLYQIYPVKYPQVITSNGHDGEIISVKEIREKMDKGEIHKYELDPMIQPYAGSHRSDNRFLTFYSKDGSVYLVRVFYDTKENKFDEPK